LRREENGAAVTLAIFTIFVILCSMLALHTFEAGYQRQLSMVQQRMATDSTRAVAATVETELNYALRLAVESGMYESGRRGENKDRVEERLRNYFNQRIEAGWSYSNFENIYVPPSDENSLVIVWLPDGSLHASGYLDNASFAHVMGARAYGVKLDAGVVPRYGRMWHLARYVYFNYMQGQNLDENARADLQNELNENYACEYLRFVIHQASLTVYDTYAGRVITENED
jgi:hypothetical protein